MTWSRNRTTGQSCKGQVWCTHGSSYCFGGQSLGQLYFFVCFGLYLFGFVMIIYHRISFCSLIERWEVTLSRPGLNRNKLLMCVMEEMIHMDMTCLVIFLAVHEIWDVSKVGGSVIDFYTGNMILFSQIWSPFTSSCHPENRNDLMFLESEIKTLNMPGLWQSQTLYFFFMTYVLSKIEQGFTIGSWRYQKEKLIEWILNTTFLKCKVCIKWRDMTEKERETKEKHKEMKCFP